MKLPKTLLSAILIGIAMQTTSSCKKEVCEDKDKKEVKKEAPKNINDCPACGMG